MNSVAPEMLALLRREFIARPGSILNIDFNSDRTQDTFMGIPLEQLTVNQVNRALGGRLPNNDRDENFRLYYLGDFGINTRGPGFLPSQIEIKEKPINKQMVVNNPTNRIFPFDNREHIQDIRVYNVALRSIKVKDFDRDIFIDHIDHMIPYFCHVFNINEKIIWDRNIYKISTIFLQEVPRCEIFPTGKFGIDIEKHQHCDNCKCWDDCCETKGIYEEQEEKCKKNGYQYIASIVQNNLKKL